MARALTNTDPALRRCWHPFGARMAEAVGFEVEVLHEDLRIQVASHELTLPLDPTAEVRTRADRATLELRRVLADPVAAVEADPS